MIADAAMGLAGNIINANTQIWANQQNYKLWKEQMAYNHPSQQMARYREAGLNPNLIYGTGQASAGNATPAPNMQPPRVDLQNIGTYANLRLVGAQTKNMEEQNKNIAEDTHGKRIENAVKDEAFVRQQAENDLFYQTYIKPEYQDAYVGVGVRRERGNYFRDDVLEKHRGAVSADYNSRIQSYEQRLRDYALSGKEMRLRDLQIIIEGLRSAGVASDNFLKELDINLRRVGVNSNDPWYVRIPTQIGTWIYDSLFN